MYAHNIHTDSHTYIHTSTAIYVRMCTSTSSQPTLDTLGEISQVEEVVGLGGRRQQVCAHAPVDLDTTEEVATRKNCQVGGSHLRLQLIVHECVCMSTD